MILFHSLLYVLSCLLHSEVQYLDLLRNFVPSCKMIMILHAILHVIWTRFCCVMKP